VGIQAFGAGQYVRTSDGFTGMIIGDSDDHETHEIMICERVEYRHIPASELRCWKPTPGEPIVSMAFEDEAEVGVFLNTHGDGTFSFVQWKSFPLPQIMRSRDLEPVVRDR
jgi:hypothetical protein